jgi:hypothetical protein
MAVLLKSSDLESLLIDWREKRVSPEGGRDKLLALLEPLFEIISKSYPLYLREDMRQELMMDFSTKAEQFAKDYWTGKIGGDLVALSYTMIKNRGISYHRQQRRIECKLVRIDDVQIEVVVYPKTYQKSKLIMKIRRALESFYDQRYAKPSYSERASRFAYAILDGKRPALVTNNLQKFFNGNRHLAQQAYTTALIVIRQVLKQHEEEIQGILEQTVSDERKVETVRRGDDES